MIPDLHLPLRDGVPQWAGIITILLVMIITATANGTCIGTTPEIVGSLSALSDDITMGYYATSVGLCTVLPLISLLKVYNTPKTMLLMGLIAEALLGLICVKTQNIDVLIAASYLTGIAKGILMITCIGLIKRFFTPNNVNSEFISMLLPFVMIVGQLSTFLTERFTYDFQWQYIYYVIIVLSLAAIVLLLSCFKYANILPHLPVREIDFKAIFLMTIALLGFVYFFSYGRTLDWFHSEKLVRLCVLTIIVFAVFLIQTNYSSKPYIRSWQLLRWEGLTGYGFMVLTMFLTASSSILSAYLSTVLGVDNLHVNSFNLWVLPGYVLGGVICFYWYRWKWRFRWLISLALWCYVAYFAIAYFGVAPNARYESLEFALVLRGTGMIILFSAFVLYLIEDLKSQEKPSHLFYIICFRGVLAPVLWAGVVSTWLYDKTQESIGKLADGIRMDNTPAADSFNSTFLSALSGGHGNYESMQMATSSLYATLNGQATLLVVKQLLGVFLLVAIVSAIVAALFPYKNPFKRDLVKRPKI